MSISQEASDRQLEEPQDLPLVESPESPESPESQSSSQPLPPLTEVYEQLRHSCDSKQLHEFATRPLPDSSDPAQFSRVVTLLEAVAGNAHTPQEDRVMLASTMLFPNVLVQLSTDDDPQVREAVASNTHSKSWLIGRLSNDEDARVRHAALLNPQASWKIRLDGACSPRTDTQTLAFLASMGVDRETDASPILSVMVRQEVAKNPHCDEETLRRLAKDPSDDVAQIANARLT